MASSATPRGATGDVPAPTVLFIAGLGRSGSTLLGRILGSGPGCTDVGELGQLWHAGLVEDRECSCGERFSACSFWSAVGKSAYGGWDQLDVAEVRRLQHRVDRLRFIPWMVLPWLNPAWRRRSRRYVALLARFYAAVAEVGDGAVPVDTSKNISTAFLLARSGQVDLRLVQLVRDCRGVAYSWTKQQARKPGADDGPLMDTYSPSLVAIRYLVYNTALRLLAAVTPGARLLQYEHAIADPQHEIGAVLDAVGVDPRPAGLHRDAVVLEQTHSLGGNPMRFRTGAIALKADTAWREKLPRRDRWIVTAIAWPALARYGYLRHDRAPSRPR